MYNISSKTKDVCQVPVKSDGVGYTADFLLWSVAACSEISSWKITFELGGFIFTSVLSVWLQQQLPELIFNVVCSCAVRLTEEGRFTLLTECNVTKRREKNKKELTRVSGKCWVQSEADLNSNTDTHLYCLPLLACLQPAYIKVIWRFEVNLFGPYFSDMVIIFLT